MTHKPTTWILDVQEDPVTGDLFLEFPADLLESQGWKEGTVLQWDIGPGGDVTLKKSEKNED
jgi:hypothetical protein